MGKKFDRKRLMYDNSQDLYFITYNILLILYNLECIGRERQFKDYRKLVYLISVISNNRETTILLDYYKAKYKANRNITRAINRLYYDSIENITLIRYVLKILERKEIITLVVEKNKTNLYINKKEKIEPLVSDERFNEEKERILKLRKGIFRLSTIKYMTFVTNFFQRNGVAIWENY